MAWTSAGQSIVAFAVVSTLLSVLAVTLRFVCRGRILRVLGPSDWFLLATLTFSIANLCCIGIHAAIGLGRPLHEFTPETRELFFKVVYTSNLLTNCSLALTKISVLLLFLDIFAISWPRKATYILIILVTLFGAWVALSSILACVPIESFWKQDDVPDPDRRCIAGVPKWYADAVVNLVLDIAIFCLPLPVVWPMVLPWRQKIWLYIAFALGVFVCLASGIRIGFIQGNGPGPKAGIALAYWLTAEINTSIVIACIPTLRPLVVRLCPRLLVAAGDDKTDDAGDPSPSPIESVGMGRLRPVPESHDGAS